MLFTHGPQIVTRPLFLGGGVAASVGFALRPTEAREGRPHGPLEPSDTIAVVRLVLGVQIEGEVVLERGGEAPAEVALGCGLGFRVRAG